MLTQNSENHALIFKMLYELYLHLFNLTHSLQSIKSAQSYAD